MIRAGLRKRKLRQRGRPDLDPQPPEGRVPRAEAVLDHQPQKLPRSDPPPDSVAPPLSKNMGQLGQSRPVGAEGYADQVEQAGLGGQLRGGAPTGQSSPGLQSQSQDRESGDLWR
jgi:hypothetical protein